jgi:hypothetical protein
MALFSWHSILANYANYHCEHVHGTAWHGMACFVLNPVLRDRQFDRPHGGWKDVFLTLQYERADISRIQL